MKESNLRKVEIVLVLVTIVFSGLWLAYPEKNYEPLAAFSGFLLFVVEFIRRKSVSKKESIDSKIEEIIEELSVVPDGDPVTLLNNAVKIRRKADALPFNAENREKYFRLAGGMEHKAQLIIQGRNA